MYKILPILLFVFLVAEIRELSTGEFYYLQSDSLDLIWAETKIDWWINRLDEQLSNIIDKDKFQINIDRKVYDVKRIDKLYADFADSMVVDSIKKVMQASFPQKHTRTFTSVSDEKYWRLAVFKIIIEISVDKTINLDGHYKNALKSIIDSGYLIWDKPSDDIIFKSVDIEEFKSQKNNKQLILNRDDIYDDSWAVIIGIDKYKYSDQLNYAVKDAEAVKDMLINKFDYPEENIRYLTNEQATLSNIKLSLGEVATSAGENDRILVFYSGHGETLKGADESETGYIVPFAGKIENLYATGLAMDDILRTCQMSKSKHMLFLMDACYSGLMTENVKSLAKPIEQGYLSKVANEKARQIITAGDIDEQVIERDEWQHSAFTKNLLAGLDDWEADTDDDGYITADELGTYLRKSVTEDSDFQQTPQKGRFRNSGGGEFVFFSDATITIPRSDTDEEDEDEIIYGCMDEGAVNYNPIADRDDGTCKYGALITSVKFGEFDINTGIVPVFIDNHIDIAGYQFDIIGAKILEGWGGVTKEYYFTLTYNENRANAYTLEGTEIPAGSNQVLLYLSIEPTKKLFGSKVCIKNIILSDNAGNDIPITSSDSKTKCFKP